MTICIAVRVSEGLVLAADSLTTITDASGQIVQNFPHAQKVSQIGDYPIGTLTWGMGSVASLPIDNLVAEFSETLTLYEEVRHREGVTVADVAQRLFDFVKERYDSYYRDNAQSKPEPLGMALGGYSTGAHFPDVYSFMLPGDSAPASCSNDAADGTPQFLVKWFGQTEPLNRLMNGADLGLLEEALRPRFADEATLVDAAGQLLAKYGYPVLLNVMPLQDAIDFAVYLITVVNGKFRFVVGPTLCGGDIDVAIVSRKGFEWLKRKTWLVN
jgi:hypothetical protein